VRNAARRAVLALLAIGVVLIGGVRLPLDDRPGTSWAFLVPVILFAAHSVLGLLVLVDGARLVAWTRGWDARAFLQAVVGLLLCLVAAVAGAASLGGAGPDVRPVMALAWAAGLGIYARLWWSSSRALRSRPESLPRGT
jgi:hypothetical protein